ncbi:hypothetical protein TeGR_g66, partial [Tetraparma gracilis]
MAPLLLLLLLLPPSLSLLPSPPPPGRSLRGRSPLRSYELPPAPPPIVRHDPLANADHGVFADELLGEEHLGDDGHLGDGGAALSFSPPPPAPTALAKLRSAPSSLLAAASRRPKLSVLAGVALSVPLYSRAVRYTRTRYHKSEAERLEDFRRIMGGDPKAAP